ncbi:FtsX-like permease family protein [Kitasatospora sp. P5_F3]
MSSPIGRVVRSGVGRRRVQTVVIAVAVMMAVASAVVAGALLVAVNAPFDRAFARQHGAHLTVQFDPAQVGAEQLDATAKLPGFTASGGPYPTTTLRGLDQEGRRTPTFTVAGRSGPGGEVDRLDLQSGRWAEQPGELVLATSLAGPGFGLGSTLRVPDAAGSPTLTVVGLALSASRTADAWVTPGQLTALASADRPVTTQRLYRLDAAGTKEQLAAAREWLAAAVPSGALLGAQSYLDTKRAADQGAAPTIPFLVAFGVLGLAMSVIIVGSVVGGAVGTGLRRIGILKAVGFTPGEVVRAYLAQALIPAGAGIALGVLLGNLLALPLLADTEQAYGAASLAVSWWVDLLVAAVALLVVGIAALVPALRAGRLRTVEAIAVGRAPRTGRGQWAHRAFGRLPLPRAVTYGLAVPFAHPVRAVAMLLAVVFGTVTATFAVGLTSSMGAITKAQDRESLAAVSVFSGAAHGPGTPAPGQQATVAADPAKVRAAVEANAGTASFYGRAFAEVTVAGIPGAAQAVLYQGDSAAGAPELISGQWLTGPGQVVVPTRFLERTGSRIGDSVRVTQEGDTRTLRIVGELFDTSNDGTRLHADQADFPKAGPVAFLVTLKPGVRPADYAEQVAAVVRPLGGEAIANQPSERGNMVLVLQAMATLLTLMLVSVAGLGVLNSVVLDTRERVRDLGICKSLGMSPSQTVLLVLTSVAGIGLLGGALGVPAGFALHGYVLPVMGHSAGTNLPSSVLEVYQAPQLALLVAAGVAIALLGALLPAGWAAKAPTAAALRAE